jgi:hypothetical protein
LTDLELALLLLGDAKLTIQKQGMKIRELEQKLERLRKQVENDLAT